MLLPPTGIIINDKGNATMFRRRAIKPAFLCLLLLASAIVCAPAAAAPLAANTRIVNTAIVTYNEGSGPIQASSTVFIALVPVLPTMTASNAITPYAGPATTLNIPGTVTTNSNGPESYTLNPTITSFVNTTGATVSGPISLDLGASVSSSGSTRSIIQVPSDSVADSSVNGLGVGETIVINGEARIITAIFDPDSGTATLTLNLPLSNAPASGVLIAEQRTINVNVTVTSGTILNNSGDITALLGITVSNGAGTTAAVTPTATFTSTTMTLAKYARNLSRPQANAPASGARSFTINGTTNSYYLSNVTAQQGEIIEYVLELTNAGTGTATGCTVTDLFPGTLVSPRVNPYANGDLWQLDENNGIRTLTWAAGDDTASLNGTTLTVNVGNGANTTLSGRLTGGQRVIVAYQVSINN